ncbi:DsbA family protein [Paraliomyxa miuraensis]|uniref:DsbA family protein n=1 Tax=Paraliomyxa miuraensis TaxID=376150 RepID=UPI00225AB8AC|nr:DsbA family protein [Paraliomyxa miuraensis]MCX4246972.1 thioredoxin domain-containing protein [Paraliomyxa miuraensis]
MTLGPGRTMVGRESGDILLHDPEASALHAEIEFTKGAVIIRDLGSRNGTWREGQRLPQFALYRGQSFRCGTTDITLVEIEAEGAPVAGGTASGRRTVGGTVDESSATLPLASASEAAKTIARHPLAPPFAPPSATPTSPTGPTRDPALAEDHTLVGPVPPPTGPGAVPSTVVPSSSTAPGTPPDASPFVVQSSTSTEPGTGAPVAAESYLPPTPIPAEPYHPHPPSAPPTEAGVPHPVPAASSAPLAPVANAVIKLGDARPKSAKHKAPVDRAARGRLIKRILLGTLVTAGVVGLVVGIYAMVAGRNQAFLRQLAREMPQDTVGVLAMSSPREALDLLGQEIPTEVRDEATMALGFDPFTAADYEAWGLDLDAPLGVSLLDGEGLFAISAGVGDRDALRVSLASRIPKLMKGPSSPSNSSTEPPEDLRWIERSFGDTPGLWLDEPVAVAALLPGQRVIFVAGGNAEQVARHAQRIAEVQAGEKKGETLADRPGFGELQSERGNLLLGLYVDGGSGRAALPGDGMQVMAMRMALADLEGFGLLVADDGPRLHVSVQTIMREDLASLTLFEDVRRKGELLDRIPAPVLAELDGVFSPDQIKSTLSAGPLAWGIGGTIEDEFRKETGLDLRTDLIDNLDGQVGWTLHKLPGPRKDREDGESSRREDDDFGMLAYAGVKDQEAAKRTAERFFGKMQDELRLGLEQVEGTTVYVVDERPRLSYFIHEGAVWAAVGNVNVAELIKGSGEPFRSKARIPAIAEAVAPGGLAAGFVDLREVLSQVRARLSEREVEDMDRWSPVLSPLEAVTMRSELDGRTFVIRWTLHTSNEHALAGLVQGLMKVAGAEMVQELAAKRRRERCEAVVDHVFELMQAEINADPLADQMFEQRSGLIDKCLEQDTTEPEIECMLAAKSLDALGKCDQPRAEANDDGGGDGGITPVEVLGQPDPLPVPYVDDIWPNTSATGTGIGTATGRPDAQVNYAVPVGADPEFRGPADALVTIVMFGDLQCPYCKRVLPTLDELLAADREVRLVFRHNPLAMHPNAESAARAVLAAAKQGKQWPMIDALYENQHLLSNDDFRTWAGELGLDLVAFDRDFHDAVTAAQVRADMEVAKKFGATGTPSFFVNGRYLVGAQPLHAFRELVDEEKARAERFLDRRGNTRKRLYEDMISHFAPEVVAPSIPTTVGTPVGEKRHAIDSSGLPRRGTAGFARVEIIECGDLDCPFCKRATDTLDRVLTDYEGKVALLWLHNPLAFHAGAEPAAKAAVAAERQGKFWEMHDELIADRSLRSRADFVTIAGKLGLDIAQFERDLDDPSTALRVSEQQKVCTDNDARGTPNFFINGRSFAGAQPYDKFKEVIDQELAGGI